MTTDFKNETIENQWENIEVLHSKSKFCFESETESGERGDTEILECSGQ